MTSDVSDGVRQRHCAGRPDQCYASEETRIERITSRVGGQIPTVPDSALVVVAGVRQHVDRDEYQRQRPRFPSCRRRQRGPGDTIVFSLSCPALISLTSGSLTINKDLTIAGPGASNVTIDASTNSVMERALGRQQQPRPLYVVAPATARRAMLGSRDQCLPPPIGRRNRVNVHVATWSPCRRAVVSAKRKWMPMKILASTTSRQTSEKDV